MLAKKETVSSKQDEIQLVLLGLKDPNSTFARQRCIIYPNDRAKIWWDVSISLVLLISCF